jgi:hypothetical protein
MNKRTRTFESVSLLLGNIANLAALYADAQGDNAKAEALIHASIAEISRKVAHPLANA